MTPFFKTTSHTRWPYIGGPGIEIVNAAAGPQVGASVLTAYCLTLEGLGCKVKVAYIVLQAE